MAFSILITWGFGGMGNDYAPYRDLKSEATAPSQSPGLTIESRLLCRIEAKKGVGFKVTLSMKPH